jgi:hypothetical protein
VAGIEPATFRLAGGRSIQLSYTLKTPSLAKRRCQFIMQIVACHATTSLTIMVSQVYSYP